jgi:hypothetical protein
MRDANGGLDVNFGIFANIIEYLKKMENKTANKISLTVGDPVRRKLTHFVITRP